MSNVVLEGIQVIDFTRALSGPVATQILADLGADVIKVERPPGGDGQRVDRGASGTRAGIANGFVAFNRNKRSVLLDLKSDSGNAAGRRLAAQAGVVVHNFRTGAAERLGLDYESVKAGNPSVVYCSISGFGREGPYARRAANDIVVQAMSGMLSLTGSPGEPPVRGVGYPVDITTGVWAALGTVAALMHRQATGEGQEVQVAMMDVVITSLARVYGEYLFNGYVPKPLGTGSDMGAPNGAFPASDGWISVAAHNDGNWAAVCAALDLREGRDPKFATQSDRRTHAAEVNAMVAAATSQLTRAEAVAAFAAVGLSCGEVRTIDEVANDPAFQRNFTKVPVAGGGVMPAVRSPLYLSRTPTVPAWGVPGPGQHQREVLTSVGYSEEEVDTSSN